MIRSFTYFLFSVFFLMAPGFSNAEDMENTDEYIDNEESGNNIEGIYEQYKSPIPPIPEPLPNTVPTQLVPQPSPKPAEKRTAKSKIEELKDKTLEVRRTPKYATEMMDLLKNDFPGENPQEIEQLKIMALQALEKVGQEGKRATPLLMSIIQDRKYSQEIKKAAADALIEIGSIKGIKLAEEYKNNPAAFPSREE